VLVVHDPIREPEMLAVESRREFTVGDGQGDVI
jgi:hypothetical protein